MLPPVSPSEKRQRLLLPLVTLLYILLLISPSSNSFPSWARCPDTGDLVSVFQRCWWASGQWPGSPGYCRRELRGKHSLHSPWSQPRKHRLKSGKIAFRWLSILFPIPSCHESETCATQKATLLFHLRFWTRRPTVKAVGDQEWNWTCPELLTGVPWGSMALFWHSHTSPRSLYKCQLHISLLFSHTDILPHFQNQDVFAHMLFP